MKAMPTLEGGLRIEVDGPGDWSMLRFLITDAISHRDDDLAERLGGLIEDTGDWSDYVVPDLREAFQDELAQVGAAIEAAKAEANGMAGRIRITRDDAWPWYSALNQARLSLEEHFRFGDAASLDKQSLSPARASAFIRSRFYCALQEVLLKYVME